MEEVSQLAGSTGYPVTAVLNKSTELDLGVRNTKREQKKKKKKKEMNPLSDDRAGPLWKGIRIVIRQDFR